MGNISPLSPIPVSYTASIPGDTTLYFVQAILRDTQSSKILQTLNLSNVSLTPNRYTGIFNAVSDPSGLGRPVDITISVYTDSGHTAQSPNYQVLQLNYVVLQPWLPTLGSGGGLNIDYEKLQKMFDGKKVSNAELINETMGAMPKFDYERLDPKPILETHKKETLAEVAKMLQPVLSAIEGHQVATESNHRTLVASMQELPSLFNRIERAMNAQGSGNSAERKELHSKLVALVERVEKTAKETGESAGKKHSQAIKEAMDSMQGYLSDNLSGKEINFLYSPEAPHKKEKKNGYTAEDVARMLS